MPLPQDDYYISPEIVGSLDRVQNNEDLYAWLKGPLTEHFVCATPPLPNTGSPLLHEMCVLPNSVFMSDSLIEIRQLRALPDVGSRVGYYTGGQEDVYATVNGTFAVGGKKCACGGRVGPDRHSG